ncbi:spherulation-specific family 4 protein [Arthrobacter sp. ISL-28]|uniref:spherulation-specific family 4 protein n=1 Tax=Arthrobacter sp. ISL-28 TaxID=2819108 RepID=UPI001BE82A83|nr:spherulation-specific family 4 protein [Arthrobacter sp. ISL-28]MBT2520035.1 spherulation-specific family 4 protein [Arthrobacter sp. ISL-28]
MFTLNRTLFRFSAHPKKSYFRHSISETEMTSVEDHMVRRRMSALLPVMLLTSLCLSLASPAAVAAPPKAPTLSAWHNGDVQVLLTWRDQSTNEKTFPIRYRIKGGVWKHYTSVPSSSGGTTGKLYSAKHTVPRGGTYCYQVGAASLDGITYSGERCAPPTVRNQHQLVPAYFYPSKADKKWEQMCDRMNNRGGSSIAVMNPGNGPGTGATANADYTRVITYCHGKAQKVIGYVYTGYGARPLAQVNADIDKYYRLYRVDGIFLDEMSNTANDPIKAYYRNLYTYIKTKTPGTEIVVGNPGVAASTAWQLGASRVADILVIFEGTAEKYKTWTPPSWVKYQPSRNFSHLVYAANDPGYLSVCQLSVLRYAGYLYVTNDILPNPWDTLPPYWIHHAPICAAAIE